MQWLLANKWLLFTGAVASVLYARQIWEAAKTPADIWSGLKKWWTRTEPVRFQYNRVEAMIVPHPENKNAWGVIPRIYLDNPQNFSIQFRVVSGSLTFDLRETTELRDEHIEREYSVGAGARNFVMELPGGSVNIRKSQASYKVRIILEFVYGRGDVPKPKLENHMWISGDLTLKFFVGRAETRWQEDRYSAAPVQDEPEVVTEDQDGLHANR